MPATVKLTKATRRSKKQKRTPRTHKPEAMTLEQWQIALRREFGREQKFKLQNLDGAAIFSDFLITNPETRRSYRVGIRGSNPGENHCSWRKSKYLSEADQRRLTCALQNMRMSCNSTYLLDNQTDFGTKADEIVARLDELLESRDAKVVIFSQWVRSHELLIRRLSKRHREFVLLHGGVPGHKRGELVDRFREEADCRIFLSTDAGGVGLNLQNASAVFNMDQPWNPAVLEQRIGRVHRLGQKNPVQVLHFVSRDTIEHGMLDLIKFKRSLFTGVLDGTQDEVFMGGTRLKKFMDGVEAATGSIPAETSAPTAPVAVVESPVIVTVAEPTLSPTTSITTPPDLYGQLFSTVIGLGKSLLQNLSAAAAAGGGPTGDRISDRATTPWQVETDPSTGKPCLKYRCRRQT